MRKRVIHFEEFERGDIEYLTAMFNEIGVTKYTFDEERLRVEIESRLSDDELLDLLDDEGFEVEGITCT